MRESQQARREQLDRRSQPRGGADRRTEPRLVVDEPAMLHLLRPSVGDAIPVRVLDMSQSGLGLRSKEPLPAGALVHIRIRDTIVAMGQVRYSARVEDEYYSGVRVEHTADCRSNWESD
jgi:hypothetical protein